MELEINNSKNMKQKLKKSNLKKFLEGEDEFITNLLVSCNVPNRVEEDDSDLYLLPMKSNKFKPPTINDFRKANKSQIKEDLDDRLLKIKNKLKAPKKNNKSEKALKRKEMKKLKKNKEIKKILISSQKAEKKLKIKTENGNIKQENDEDIKPGKKVFNEQGKILFSKIDFASYPGAKIIKGKKDKVMKNPKDILKKMKETDKKILELKEQGEEDKARELKNDLVWKNAFDKIQGKKVKDDRNLLFKSIKRKKNLKKKSKQSWKDRKEKVEQDISSRQKKREDNINKRKKDNKLNKMKKMSKKGRVIPGF